MQHRRSFLKKSIALTTALPIFNVLKSFASSPIKASKPNGLIVSTWDAGIRANAAAWKIIGSNGTALDAVEAGVKITELENNCCVGLNGRPDRDGFVTLDACIMDDKNRCGSVAMLQKIKHPISVARAVMEKTPHVMLVGEGAQQFALEQGFKHSDYVNPEAHKAWEEWLKTSEYKPVINIENHDTIGLLAMDYDGKISGSCTTSGLSYKLHGRVGDSPIIGAGLYIDNEVGGATCTGLGETVIRSCTSFLVVELMRQGATAQEACEEAIARLKSNNAFMTDEYQVGVLAVDKAGDTGAYGLRSGFTFALCKEGKNQMYTAGSLIR
jgi:isoaspartyl peptidase/L-asparaginase-like protein (Ntn-hydrolase superfamily)